MEKTLLDEIDSAIDGIANERQEKVPADESAPAEKAPEVDKQDPDEESQYIQDGEAPEEPVEDLPSESSEDEPAITDDLLMRAANAGIHLSDARKFQDAKTLEKMCGLLEQKGGKQTVVAEEKPAQGDAAPESDDGVESLLASLPDLENSDLDESIVGAFKTVKQVIIQQGKTIADLQNTLKNSQGDSKKSWFDSKVASLGEAYKGATAEKHDELRNMCDVLESGYKAKGQSPDRDSVFDQAVSLVLGDEKQKAHYTKVAEKLQRRESLQTSRPSGDGVKAKGDAISEIADEIDRKHFNKTN